MFTPQGENSNFGSRVVFEILGEINSVDFQISLGKKVAHKQPNPSKEHRETRT